MDCFQLAWRTNPLTWVTLPRILYGWQWTGVIRGLRMERTSPRSTGVSRSLAGEGLKSRVIGSWWMLASSFRECLGFRQPAPSRHHLSPSGLTTARGGERVEPHARTPPSTPTRRNCSLAIFPEAISRDDPLLPPPPQSAESASRPLRRAGTTSPLQRSLRAPSALRDPGLAGRPPRPRMHCMARH